MKVTTETPDILVVDDKPVLLGLALILFILVFSAIGINIMMSGEPWGLVFLGLGGGIGFLAFWAFVRRVQVVFHRSDGYVELRRRNLFGGSVQRFALSEIARADLEESGSFDQGSTWRVALVIDEGQNVGRHPITLAYTNGRGHRIVADAINRWLAAGTGGLKKP